MLLMFVQIKCSCRSSKGLYLGSFKERAGASIVLTVQRGGTAAARNAESSESLVRLCSDGVFGGCAQ